MPELPEVERARRVLEREGLGKVIQHVDAAEDTIVFAGCSHTEFATELRGRAITAVKRYGKLFYAELEGEGRMPVLHFGMTGLLHIKGQDPMHYRLKRKTTDVWPPKAYKFVLHLASPASSHPPSPITEIAFVDPRRLGRVRLVSSPSTEPPISALGFDPLLSPPTPDHFTSLVRARNCPIKALLLDQTFSAGVGNWVADEILYHARVHPERRAKTLSDDEISEVRQWMKEVCKVAVEVDADSDRFPEDWLFKHRWGKGKKGQGASDLKLPNGEPATITWCTVGGRTSAFVPELQKPPASDAVRESVLQSGTNDREDSDLTPISSDEDITSRPAGVKRKSNGKRNFSAVSTKPVRSQKKSRLASDK